MESGNIICPGTVSGPCSSETETVEQLVEHLAGEHGYEHQYAFGLASRAASVSRWADRAVAAMRGEENDDGV